MIFLRKNFFKILITIILLTFLIIAPYPLFTKINSLNYNLNSEYKFEYNGVIELWNVDTFEGGSVSRTTFIENRCVEFEKKHKGVLILVKNITLEQLELNLKSNKKPSIITFGIGTGDYIVNDLVSISSQYNIRDDLIKSSIIDKKIKALPIMLGGYSLITNKEKLSSTNTQDILSSSLIYSREDYNIPLFSLFVNNLAPKVNSDISVNSFDAYDKFIHENYNSLLGTQRDFFRCKNRENNLKMQCNYINLGGYTDLIVYGGIFKSNAKTEQISQKFLEYLVSDNVQDNLSNIGMFSVLNKNIYTDDSYKEFNKTLLKPLKTINVFYSNVTLKNIKNSLEDYFYNLKDNKNEILKYLN